MAGDPEGVAAEAPEWLSWLPSRDPDQGGANFKTRRLVQVHRNRLTLQASIGDRVFSAVFGGMGAVALVMAPMLFLSEDAGVAPVLLCLTVGSVFVAFGVWQWRRGSRGLVFDLGEGSFWEVGSARSLDEEPLTSLEDVAGLQLLSKEVSGSNGGWTAHELNLVLRDGKRRLLMDPPNLAEVRRDATRLGTFLDVPIWDRARGA